MTTERKVRRSRLDLSRVAPPVTKTEIGALGDREMLSMFASCATCADIPPVPEMPSRSRRELAWLMWWSGATMSEIANEFGVSVMRISAMLNKYSSGLEGADDHPMAKPMPDALRVLAAMSHADLVAELRKRYQGPPLRVDEPKPRGRPGMTDAECAALITMSKLGLSGKQIAERLGVSHNVAWQRLHRARRRADDVGKVRVDQMLELLDTSNHTGVVSASG